MNLPDHCTVNDCITFSLKEINKELGKKGLPYSLSAETNLFYLFLAKKNGKPKLDYPGKQTIFSFFYLKYSILIYM